MPFSVAIVEDEAILLRTVCRFLGKAGYAVSGYGDAESFLAAQKTQPVDVAVLDVNLPGQDGFETAALIRDLSPSVGIVILTARGAADDRVTGLLNGADNYLTKPLHLMELHVVIQNLTRRIALERGAENASPPSLQTTPTSWRLDEQEWRLISPMGVATPLTATEYRIMQTLMKAPGGHVSRDALLEAIGKKVEQDGDRRIDNLLSLLRRKVRNETGGPLPVKSIRSSGYAFTGMPTGGDESAS